MYTCLGNQSDVEDLLVDPCVGNCRLMSYQALNIGMDSVRTGWCLSTSTECSTIVLQGFNTSSLMLQLNETLPIPGHEKVNISTRQPLAFRLAAISEDGTVCSNDEHFYTFDSKFAWVATTLWVEDQGSKTYMALSTFCNCKCSYYRVTIGFGIMNIVYMRH